jgi:type I restriction enzyme S subunit
VRQPAWITDNALWTSSWAPDWSIDFVFYYLEWFDLRTTQSRTGQPLVTQASIGVVPIPRPNPKEQAAIAQALDDAGERLEGEFSSLEKLRMLRRGLMDDLLTGRVRVNVDEDAA